MFLLIAFAAIGSVLMATASARRASGTDVFARFGLTRAATGAALTSYALAAMACLHLGVDLALTLLGAGVIALLAGMTTLELPLILHTDDIQEIR